MKTKFEDSDAEDAGTSSGSEPEELPATRRARGGGGGGGGESGSGDDDDDDGGDSDGPSTSGGGSDDDAEERRLEAMLAEDVPLEVLARLKADGLGPTGDAARAAAAAAKGRSFRRETKNRPQEASSKRPVSRFREVIQVPKQRGTDPRFDVLGGGAGAGASASAPSKELESQRKRYAFLYDEVIPAERAALKQRLKKERREPKRRELQAEITRLEQRLRDERERRKRSALEKGWKAEQKAAVDAGAKPFYLKKSEKRKRELVAKYEELKASGGLDKFMEKRRRKNASKDHRYLPGTRRAGGGWDE